MRAIVLPSLLSVFPAFSQLQCDTLPITYDPSSQVFEGSSISFGDSVLTLSVTNASTAPMAYPWLRLVPATPMPQGLVLNTDWSVFASSWNPGETAVAEIYFDVNTPLLVDATVTFEVWAGNLSPLLETDSCRFVQDLTVNFNPMVQSLGERGEAPMLQVGPLPASESLTIVVEQGQVGGGLELFDLNGRCVQRLPVDALTITLPVSDLPVGAYMLVCRGRNGAVSKRIVSLAR